MTLWRRLVSRVWGRSLPAEQKRIVAALAEGWTLKSHRFLDGQKEYRLHPLHGEPLLVPGSVVHALQRRGLLQSNQKFPAATFLLTERGRSLGQHLAAVADLPLTARDFLCAQPGTQSFTKDKGR